MNKAHVYIVGAGAGDPALLTIKGQMALEAADVVLYDRLLHPGLLYLAPKTAKLVYCGKTPNEQKHTQSAIIEILLEYAKQHLNIVRLKGGDPGIFGRVNEEISALKLAQIHYTVIPGITAAVATSLYNEVAMTNRLAAQHVTFISATTKTGDFLQANFGSMLEGGTLAIYMGMEQFDKLLFSLKKAGDETVPIMLCEWGTYGRQKKIIGTLGTISKMLENNPLKNPTMILVGATIQTVDSLSWFEKLPQFGKKILKVTDKQVTFKDVLLYTEQGADIWIVDISENRDRRFDEISRRYLKENAPTFIEYSGRLEKLDVVRYFEELGIKQNIV